MILSNSSVLNERYVIQSVLGEIGPLDVNYLAWDLKAEKEVVVREYYPVRLAKRAKDGLLLEVHDAGLFEYGLGAYSAEGMLLTKVEHPHVAACQEQFKQNGTVYCVHNFIAGAPLGAYLKQQEGRLAEEDAMAIIEKVLGALHVCHERKLYHGGISPRSIFVDPDGNPTLLSFKAARFKLARECGCLEDIIKPGFSAPEQVVFESEEGPWWDIYGSAATLFHMLTGRLLPVVHDGWSASKIKVVLYSDTGLSNEICDVLATALAYEERERPASVLAFRDMLMATQQHVAHQLHEGDGARQFEVGFSTEKDPTGDAWENGVEVTAANVKMETEAPALKENEPVENEMPEVIPDKPHQLLQASNGQHHALEPANPARASDREQELEMLLTKIVKWQQVFVAFILGIVVIALLGLVGGVFFGMNFFQNEGISTAQAERVENSSQLPLPAAAATGLADLDAGAFDDTSQPETVAVAPEDDGDSHTAEAAGTQQAGFAGAPATRVPDPEPVQVAPEAAPSREAVTETTEQETDAGTAEKVTAVPAGNRLSGDEVGDLQVDSNDEINLLETDSTAGSMDSQESLFHYYRVQGDSLMNQGFATAALQWYKNALKYKSDDTYIAEQILAIETSIAAEVRAKTIQDSLAARLEQVRDQYGIFVLPDTPVTIVNEESLRNDITYPIAALREGITGRVILRYIVDEEGRLEDINIVKKLGWGTEEVVMDQLRNATFQPATFNGEPVRAWATFSTVFRMAKEE